MEKLKAHKCFSGVTEFFKHPSSVIGTDMNFAIHRPEKMQDIKGGLVWLSGLTCNEQNFITKAGAQKLISDSGLVVICPDTSPRGLDLPGEHDSYDFGSGAGFYVDATTDKYKDHYKMYSYINEELYDLFNSQYNLKGNISLFGHSMGGHGALTIGLKSPNKYKSISAFSPIVNPSSSGWGQKAFKGYLGSEKKTWAQYDACLLMSSGEKHPAPILIDQGLSDEFYPDQLLTENFKRVCKELGQEVNIRLQEGYDHSYYFISSFVEDHINHHKKYLA